MARILLVDDDALTRAIGLDILTELGHVVELAKDGLEGLERFRAHRHEVVISDIQMPVMDGFELIQELREICPEVLIICASAGAAGLGMGALKVAGLLGAKYCMAKPFTSEKLAEALAFVLAAAPDKEPAKAVQQLPPLE